MKKKRVLITGGSRGIGKAIVERLAANPLYEIVFTYKQDEKSASELVQRLQSSSPNIRSLRMDLLNREEIQVVSQREMEEHGPFEILILNAGMAQDTILYFMEERQWNDVLSVSLNSFYYLSRLVLPKMIEQRWGRIVTITSVSGEAGNRGQTNYAAAKGALIAATKSLAKEVGSRGVLVNSVSPGVIETDMTENLPKDEIKKVIPLQRFGKPSEVAHAVHFLISDEASYISGEVLRVNGGLYT